jgi:hypothetical protein
VGARVQHHLFFQLVAELEGRSLLIPPSQGPVFNWDAPRTSSLLGTACKCLTFEIQVKAFSFSIASDIGKHVMQKPKLSMTAVLCSILNTVRVQRFRS